MDVKYLPYLGIRVESQEPRHKGEAKYLSLGSRVRLLETFVDTSPSFYTTGSANGTQEGIPLTLEERFLWSVFSSWGSKKGCCLADKPSMTEECQKGANRDQLENRGIVMWADLFLVTYDTLSNGVADWWSVVIT